MNSLFAKLNDKQTELMAARDKLIDQQENLKVHHYRSQITTLTAEDRKYDQLQVQIDAINNELYANTHRG